MLDHEMLILGLAIFFSIHLLGAIHWVRHGIREKLGQNFYRLIHAIVSLGGLFLIITSYAYEPYESLWFPTVELMKTPFIAMPVALFFLTRMDVPRKITRHPMLWGVAIWSAAHLLANGETRAIWLFGSFFVYAFLAMWLADQRKQKEDPLSYNELAAKSSFFPFVALIQKRAEPIKLKSFVATLLVTAILYIALLVTHPYFTGIVLIS